MINDDYLKFRKIDLLLNVGFFTFDMTKKILIILGISVYSVVLIFIGSTIERVQLGMNGAFLSSPRKDTNGYYCMTNYNVDGNQILSVYDDKISSSCPDKIKTVDISREDLKKLIEKEVENTDRSTNPRFIIQ